MDTIGAYEPLVLGP